MKISIKKSTFYRKLKAFLLIICGENGQVDKTVLWTAINTILTFILLLFAFFQIRQVSITNKGALLNEFRPIFSDHQAMDLVMLLDHNLLTFSQNTGQKDKNTLILPNNLAYFTRSSDYPQLNKLLVDSTKIIYTYNDIDKYLLNPMTDLALNVEWGAIDLKEVYAAYGYYIEVVWGNVEIQKYIQWNAGIYENEPDGGYQHIQKLYSSMQLYKNK